MARLSRQWGRNHKDAPANDPHAVHLGERLLRLPPRIAGRLGGRQKLYDQYYGDPDHPPQPQPSFTRPKRLYVVRIVLSDLGTCGGITADEHGRALRGNGQAIPGLYAVGNTAADVFGTSYPGAGATIGQASCSAESLPFML